MNRVTSVWLSLALLKLVVEKREAPAEAAEAPEAQDQTEDEEAAVEPQPMIEVGFCKFSLRVANVCRDPPSNPFIPTL